MPIISVFFGILIRMFYKEHESAHFHADYQAQQGKFDLDRNMIVGVDGTEMDFGIVIRNPIWKTIAEIPRGTTLVKGMHKVSRYMCGAARAETDRFGCYRWTASGVTLYCGSFSKDYRHGGFATNLEGRVRQYFCNHERADDGSPKNTNARIFDQLNQALGLSTTALQLLGFESLFGAGREITFAQYTDDSALVRAVERLVIWTYKDADECPWNDQSCDDGE